MNPDPASLGRLHDIVTPPPVPWWPLAPGWYWIMALVASVMVALLIQDVIHWQRNRYRREALAELKRRQDMLDQPNQRVAALAALGELLKRTALTVWPRMDVAALNGPQWFAFLDRAGHTDRFSRGIGALLEDIAYDSRRARAIDDAKARELTEAVSDWIKNHRVVADSEGGVR